MSVPIASIIPKIPSRDLGYDLCDIHFETDLSEFNSTALDGTNFVWSAAAGMRGSSGGLANTINGTTTGYGRKLFSNVNTGIVRCRYYFDPNSVTGTQYYKLYPLYGYNAALTTIFRSQFVYRTSGNPYRAMLGGFNDAGGWTETAEIGMTDAPHYIELMVTRSSPGLTDGLLWLSVDGGTPVSVAIANNTRFIGLGRLNLGLPAIDAGFTGTYFTDELKVNCSGIPIGA